VAVSASDQAAIAELFEFVPELRLRRMFGGVGIFTGDMMFALATQDGLFLRDDPESAPAYAARACALHLARQGRERAPDGLPRRTRRDLGRPGCDPRMGAARDRGGAAPARMSA
jgi:hypothetical protein